MQSYFIYLPSLVTTSFSYACTSLIIRLVMFSWVFSLSGAPISAGAFLSFREAIMTTKLNVFHLNFDSLNCLKNYELLFFNRPNPLFFSPFESASFRTSMFRKREIVDSLGKYREHMCSMKRPNWPLWSFLCSITCCNIGPLKVTWQNLAIFSPRPILS